MGSDDGEEVSGEEADKVVGPGDGEGVVAKEAGEGARAKGRDDDDDEHEEEESESARRSRRGEDRPDQRLRREEDSRESREKEEGRRAGKRSLLVRNLSFRTTKHDLGDMFEKYGGVRDVYIPVDYQTREPRGFAFVEFVDPDGASAAIDAMDGEVIDGRSVRVVYAQQQRKRPDEMAEMERRLGRGGYHDDDDHDDRRGRRRRDDREYDNYRGREDYSRQRRRDRSRSRDRGYRRDRDYDDDDDDYDRRRRRREDDHYGRY